MRRNIVYAGAVLALAAMGAVMVGSALDLDLESVALLGAAMGAVIALVPDRTPLIRLAGFAIGFLIGWAGYVIRAQFMPDTSSGRAVAVGVAVLLCVAVAAGTADRITLWTILLGAGAFAGAYEFTYNEAPPELLSTSLSTATTMAFNVAVGFLAGALVAPISGSTPEAPRGHRAPEAPAGDDRVDLPEEHGSVLDSFMTESAK
jgi:hypothetical protein